MATKTSTPAKTSPATNVHVSKDEAQFLIGIMSQITIQGLNPNAEASVVMLQSLAKKLRPIAEPLASASKRG